MRGVGGAMSGGEWVCEVVQAWERLWSTCVCFFFGLDRYMAATITVRGNPSYLMPRCCLWSSGHDSLQVC